MSAEQRVKDLGLDLPLPPNSAGNYVPGVQTGNLLFLSGCVSRRADGSAITGKVGRDPHVDQAHDAARVAALPTLSRNRPARPPPPPPPPPPQLLPHPNTPPSFL